MNQKEKENLIKDIEALVNISDNLARSFHFKAKELRDMYRDDIDNYNSIKDMIEGRPLNIKFEMANKDGSWTVSIPGKPDFIPNEIVTHIVNRVIKSDNSNIIQIDRNFETKDKRKFNLAYEKKEDVISGTITEERENHGGDLLQGQSEAPKMNEYNEFFLYLTNIGSFGNWIINEFYTNWKPLIDAGCVQGTKRS